MKILFRSLEDKQLVWFESSNKYVRMEQPAFDVFDHLNSGASPETVTIWCSRQFALDLPEAKNFVDEIRLFVSVNSEPSVKFKESSFPAETKVPSQEEFHSSRYYRFSGSDFCLQYGHEKIEQLVHPLMAHMETDFQGDNVHQFQLFRLDESLYLRTNGRFIGQWGMKEQHYLKGKVFLELLNKAWGKEEDDWMAVLHASAVSKGNSGILFAGNSGSGKSTILSILLANGFTFMADDFVPLDSKSGEVFPFPVAISVKEGSLELLEEKFPELKTAETFEYEAVGKRVRYLSPKDYYQTGIAGTKVRALIFVNYSPGRETVLEKFPTHEAIHLLVTESWISNIPENVERFMDWFIDLPCYRITYSDNQEMVEIIQTLFDEKV